MSDKTENAERVKKLREIAFDNLKQPETVSYAFHSYAHHEQDNEMTSEDFRCLLDVLEGIVISVSNSVRAWMKGGRQWMNSSGWISPPTA